MQMEVLLFIFYFLVAHMVQVWAVSRFYFRCHAPKPYDP